MLDHRLVELAATIPADVKFKDGNMKHVFKRAVRSLVPPEIHERTDKMGFPVPLTEWIQGPAKEFVRDTLSTRSAQDRELFDNRKALQGLENEGRFSRKLWGLLSLELWQQAFHDREREFKALATESRSGGTVHRFRARGVA
jgi:asparagine synthase (glutamine-hydrolysing)